MRTEALVRKAQRGDAASREALARAWLPPVYGVALGIMGRAPDADDVTQETFIRAFRALPTLRRPSRFGPWIAQIARNVARDLKRKPRPATLEADATASADATRAIGDDEATVIAWRGLPEDERLVIWLKVVDGMTIRAIAELLDTSKSRVDRALRRALESMRRELSRC